MTKTTLIGIALTIVAVVGQVTGCKKEHERASIALMQPQSLDKYVVFIDKQGDAAYLLDVVGQELQAETKRIELGPSPVLAQRRNGTTAQELLVLCQGKEEQIGQKSQAAQLVVIEATGGVRHYPLNSRFNALMQSQDGALAVLYFAEGQAETGSSSGSDLTRRNQVAIVDLNADAVADKNPAVRQIDSDDGSAPAAVVISPLIKVADKERRVAVIMFRKQVSLLDLSTLAADPVREEIKIPFDYQIATFPVLFGSDDKGAATVYVRSAQSDDIYIMYLLAATGKSNDFWPKIEMRKAGSISSDMALYQEPVGDGTSSATRLLVVSQSGQRVSVIDPATGDASEIALGFGADRALVYQGKAPFDQTVAPRALIYNSQGMGNKVAFLDLVGVKELAKAFASLLKLSSDKQQVALVEQGSGISLLSLEDRSIDPIETGTLSAVVLDGQQKTLWLPYQQSDPKRVQLGYIDTDTGDTGYVLLDAAIDTVVPVSSGQAQRVVVTHPSEVGYVTVLEAASPKRDTAVSLQGFLLTDALD